MEKRNRNVGTEYLSVAEVLPLVKYSIERLGMVIESAWDGMSSISRENIEEMELLGQQLFQLTQQEPTPSQMHKFLFKYKKKISKISLQHV